jgi:hypothetical protein
MYLNRRNSDLTAHTPRPKDAGRSSVEIRAHGQSRSGTITTGAPRCRPPLPVDGRYHGRRKLSTIRGMWRQAPTGPRTNQSCPTELIASTPSALHLHAAAHQAPLQFAPRKSGASEAVTASRPNPRPRAARAGSRARTRGRGGREDEAWPAGGRVARGPRPGARRHPRMSFRGLARRQIIPSRSRPLAARAGANGQVHAPRQSDVVVQASLCWWPGAMPSAWTGKTSLRSAGMAWSTTEPRT